MEPRVVSFYSVLGGSGKTASAFGLATAAVANNLRTLLVDMDPQLYLTSLHTEVKLNSDNPEGKRTVTLGGDGVPVIHAVTDLVTLQSKLVDEFSFYDLIIVDTPTTPRVDLVVLLSISDIVIVPEKTSIPEPDYKLTLDSILQKSISTSYSSRIRFLLTFNLKSENPVIKKNETVSASEPYFFNINISYYTELAGNNITALLGNTERSFHSDHNKLLNEILQQIG